MCVCVCVCVCFIHMFGGASDSETVISSVVL